MTIEPLVSQQEEQSNPILWCVKTYIDLVSRDAMLGYGNGLKRLYVMKHGIPTFNDDDISAIAAKAERMKLIPGDLNGFMQQCICKNLELYGKELRQLLSDRVIAISNGDIRNPLPLFKFSADEARRFYYVPPFTFVRRLYKVLTDYSGDIGDKWNIGSQPLVTSLMDIANDADFLMTRMDTTQGHITPTQTSWGLLMKCVDLLVDVLEHGSRFVDISMGYKSRSRSACKILWILTKLLMGDLTIQPLRKDINLADIDGSLRFTDGTLAAIPFPLQKTAKVFCDSDGPSGVSLKGHLYLSAVSGATFYRNNPNEGGDS